MTDVYENAGSLLYSKNELLELAKQTHTNSKNHGWWEGKLEDPKPGDSSGLVQLILAAVDYEEKMVLIASEVAEAFEEYRKPNIGITEVYFKNDKPEGFPIEMADAFIRVLDLIGALESSGISSMFLLKDFEAPIQIRHLGPDVGGHCFQVLRAIVKCYDIDLGLLRADYLPYVLRSIEQACLDLHVDLDEAIRLKMTYNASRPYRHGGLRA